MGLTVTGDRPRAAVPVPSAERMTVALHVHRPAELHATGIGRYARELVCALEQVGGDRHDLLLTSMPEAQVADWIPGGVRTRVVPWPRRTTQAGWCLGLGPRLERAAGRLDVVHLTLPFPPVKTTAPQVVTVHDLFPLERPGWYRRSERWTYARSIDLALRRAARIVVPSRYVADRLQAILDVDPGRVVVVPQGISGAFARPRPENELAACCARFGVQPGGFVVCLGAVSTRKNVIALVRGMAGISCPLVLVGPDGYGAESVDAEIAGLHGRARVIRTGYVSDDDAAALVRSAAILAHPALGEGFGFVPLEAMAADTPVVAAGLSAIPEVVGDAAVLVDEPTQPEAWTDALTALLASPERSRALAQAGRRRAREFSWRRTALRMLEVYEDVARR